MFGWSKKVKGKIVRGKIVEGMKVSRKWMESEMIILLFGIKESGKKVEGKIDIFLLNDINIPTLIYILALFYCINWVVSITF